MSKRWRRGHTVVAAPTTDAELLAELEKSNVRNRELCESRDRLHALYNAEIRRADVLEAERDEAWARIEELELVRDALAAKLAAHEDGHSAACEHAAEVRRRDVTLKALQARLTEVTEVNQGHDRYRASVGQSR